MTGIWDSGGNITTVARDGAGNPLSITAPDGQTTAFTLDARGYLKTFTNPARVSQGQTTVMTEKLWSVPEVCETFSRDITLDSQRLSRGCVFQLLTAQYMQLDAAVGSPAFNRIIISDGIIRAIPPCRKISSRHTF